MVAAGVAAAVALAGCSGGGDNGGLPTYTPGMGGSTSSSATPSHPVPPTPLGYTPADPDKIGHWTVFTSFSPRNADERAVYEAWVRFWRAEAEALNRQTIDFKVLDSVATGNWRSGLLRLIGDRVVKSQRTVGATTFQVRSIQVAPGVATVEYCVDDSSYEVDTRGSMVVPAPGAALQREKLLLVGGRWLVADQPLHTAGGCTISGRTS